MRSRLRRRRNAGGLPRTRRRRRIEQILRHRLNLVHRRRRPQKQKSFSILTRIGRPFVYVLFIFGTTCTNGNYEQPEHSRDRRAKRRKKRSTLLTDDEEDSETLAAVGARVKEERLRTQSAEGSMSAEPDPLVNRTKATTRSHLRKTTSHSPAPTLPAPTPTAKSKSPAAVAVFGSAGPESPDVPLAKALPTPILVTDTVAFVPPTTQPAPSPAPSTSTTATAVVSGVNPPIPSGPTSLTKSASDAAKTVPGFNKHRGAKLAYVRDGNILPPPLPEQSRRHRGRPPAVRHVPLKPSTITEASKTPVSDTTTPAAARSTSIARKNSIIDSTQPAVNEWTPAVDDWGSSSWAPKQSQESLFGSSPPPSAAAFVPEESIETVVPPQNAMDIDKAEDFLEGLVAKDPTNL